MGLAIDQVDTRTASEAVLQEMHKYYISLYAEDLPNDPPVPYERQAADWKYLREHETVPRWLLREDGEIAGVAVAFMDLEQNLENGFGRIHVRPERRGRGFARRLAQPVVEALEAGGRERIATSITRGAEAEGFAEWLGLKSVYADKRSRLVIAEIDQEMIRQWIDRAPERASDYELLYVESPFPDEVLDKYCDLQFALNTAPREDLESDDEVTTPAIWRDTEEKQALKATDLRTYVAVHRPSGDFVGSTTVLTDRLQPDQAWQWETVVVPEHRDRGLGRWLKAAMIEKLVTEFPAVDRIDTWNAGSNEPMLNINIAMGFKPIHLSNTWQGKLQDVKQRLDI